MLHSFPLIQILSLSGKNIEALKNVDDVVNASSLNIKLFSALVKRNHSLVIMAIKIEESLAKVSKTLILSAVLPFPV